MAVKRGVLGMTNVALLKFGPQQILVNSVAPRAIDTPMLAAAFEEIGTDKDTMAPHFSLLNRFGQGREVAQASLWLASEQSSCVTGTTPHVEAGYTAR